MMELAISTADADLVASEILGGESERCAVLFASRVDRADGGVRFIVRNIEIPSPESYTEQTAVRAELNPAFVAKISKNARMRGDSIVFIHSHLDEARPEFSRIDDLGENRLADFLAVRMPGVPHVSVVVSAGGWCGRQLGTSNPIKIVSIGERRDVLFEPGSCGEPIQPIFDRQVRAFGEAGQRVMESLTVAIVGLGGTGSVAAEQLAHLGVRRFVLIDPDKLEPTNLNRVVGASKGDIELPKVEVAANHIAKIAPEASVKCVQGDITRTRIARELIPVDFIFSCTDSHGSRAVIQQISYQYLIPCVDVGSILTAKNGRVTGIHGRIQALAPGLPCFSCSGLIDAEEVRRDMMNEEERRLDPYIQGAQEPAPAVISINSTVTSLAVTMFMSITLGIPSEGRYVLYNANRPSLRSVTASQNPTCYICSPSGVLGRGNSQALFTRND
ncbi:MAG: ThiF family adenylyltransferase [Sideroxydans sp.]|nr:ThiF family adenylyltransferase [Sideroxydans sp.]